MRFLLIKYEQKAQNKEKVIFWKVLRKNKLACAWKICIIEVVAVGNGWKRQKLLL